MAQAKRKFKDGDIVYDGYSRVIGRVSGYLGRGLYTLDNIRAPFLDKSGRVRNYLDLIPDMMDPHVFGVEGERQRTYIQTSRYLNNPNPELLKLYNEKALNPAENEIYFYDGYQNLFKLGELKVENRGGVAPVMYSVKTTIQERWSINGYIFNGANAEIRSVQKIDRPQSWMFALNQPNYGLYKNEVEFVFDWEKEFAPYVIGGMVI